VSEPSGWDPRAVLALVVIVCAFILAGIHLVVDSPDEATIPAWVAALVAGIGLFYYRNGKGG
jgi:hypothetical protein